jgi:cell shape-determining protein MreD
MIRYLILIFLLAAALVVREALATIPCVGYAAPAMGLLLVLVYAMKGSGEEYLILSFFAGVLEGSLSDLPGGFYILAYCSVAWMVIRIRGHLFTEYALTQVVIVFLAGCFMEVAYLLVLAAGVIAPEGGALELLRPLCSSASAALLAPLASKVFEGSSLIRGLFKK